MIGVGYESNNISDKYDCDFQKSVGFHASHVRRDQPSPDNLIDLFPYIWNLLSDEFLQNPSTGMFFHLSLEMR